MVAGVVPAAGQVEPDVGAVGQAEGPRQETRFQEGSGPDLLGLVEQDRLLQAPRRS